MRLALEEYWLLVNLQIILTLCRLALSVNLRPHSTLFLMLYEIVIHPSELNRP